MSSPDKLISTSRRAVAQRRALRPQAELELVVARLDPIRPFTESVVGEEISFVLRCIDSSEQLAEAVEAAVAGMFVTSDDELAATERATPLPLLHRGLLVDPYQLYEAREAGADGVVLVASVFDDDDAALAAMHRVAGEIGLDVVVQVASEREIEHTLELLDPDTFLIRNRDGERGVADFERTFSLLEEVPAGKAVLSQGGIRTPEQTSALEGAGVDAAVLGRWIYAEGVAQTLDWLRGDVR
jgi:indole-3-glycerol phosphate synthase